MQRLPGIGDSGGGLAIHGDPPPSQSNSQLKGCEAVQSVATHLEVPSRRTTPPGSASPWLERALHAAVQDFAAESENGAQGTRTPNFQLAKLALYQLS